MQEGLTYTVSGVMGWFNGAQIYPISADFCVRVNSEDPELPVVSTLKAEKKTFNESLSTTGPLTEGCLPSVGNPNVLVIPVNLDSTQMTDANLNDIKVAFTGTSETTGWESVTSYYTKSSYGKLNINFTVLDSWFTPSKTMKYYNNYYDEANYEDGSTLILKEALAYYDDTIDYTNYDLDKDGIIDSVWLIYNCAVDYTNDNSLYWAFTSWYYGENTYDGMELYYYAFAGIDFMHPTLEEADTYDPSDIKVDAHTYIHETGHLLGLDDYYDYDEKAGINGDGYYGCDMMDYNIGDHGPISKLLLGWISPTVVSGTGSISLTLSSFTLTGDCLIVNKTEINSIYSTYYMVEFYTNDGVNAHDKMYDSNSVSYGVRVTIVRAEKNIVNGEVDYNSGNYQTGFKYDNSDESKMFVEVITQSKYAMLNNYSVNSDCLFQVNETLNQSGVPFTLTVTAQSATETTVEITIK